MGTQDRIRGLLTMGAYGDALGAPYESRGLAGMTYDPRGVHLHVPDIAGTGDWGIWAPARELESQVAVLTDDPSYRLSLLHEWIATASELSERSFRRWLARPTWTDGARPAWLVRHRESQRAEWVEMLDGAHAAPPCDAGPFFRVGQPVFLGLYLYLDLAILDAPAPASEVFTKFASFSRLDQGYGRAVTGLLAALVARAAGAEPLGDDLAGSFRAWLRDETDSVLAAAAIASDDAELRRALALVQAATEEMRAFASERARATPKGFVEALRASVYSDSARPFARRASFDPLYAWMLVVAAVEHAAGDPWQTLHLLAGSPGDSDTIASIFGTLAGARVGRAALGTLERDGRRLEGDLRAVERLVAEVYGVDLDERVARFQRASTAELV